MNPYMFVINAIPAPSNKDCEDIAGARVHIWVISEDKESAKIRALDYITKYLWEVKNVEYEFEIQQELIQKLGEDELRLYQKALLYGIAADFLAHPRIPGNPDDPAVKRRLDLP
ncbi:hypothetical protein [Paenibacillus piscarius]|uniref:hypothetical protein n=1 Tax=Paenibacillus piscarius TaxID=1089681 RepID=UPI001EE8D1B9|nr:hypothetical protein [Paenibacillus piscarius]